MQFSLEGILETLLVGTIASLCIVLPLFLMFGHHFRIDSLRRLSKLLFYEAAFAETTEPNRTDQPYWVFLTFMLCALLFGLGVVTESASDFFGSHLPWRARFFSDTQIKIDAFQSVGKSWTKSGTAPPAFVEFFTDYLAVAARGEDEIKDCAPCQLTRDRALGVYYTAKNRIFGDPNYFQELDRLQNRINFTRAVSLSLSVLGFELLVAFLIGAIAEHLSRRPGQRPLQQPLATSAGPEGTPAPSPEPEPSVPESTGSYSNHWKNLAAKRCLAMGVVTVVLFAGVQQAWNDLEEQFDKRVFGYFTVLPLTHNDLPRSPYRVFRLGSGESFEPSAVEGLPGGRRVLVANDKGGEQPFVIFDVIGSDSLANPRIVREDRPDPNGPSLLAQLGKLESVDVQHIGGRVVVRASGNFSRVKPANRRIFSFELDVDAATASRIHFEKDPMPEFAFGVTDTVSVECVIEGLAYRDTTDELLLGVRAFGPKGLPRPETSILSLKRSEFGWVTSRRTVQLPEEFNGQGVSGIDVLDNRHLLVLTSLERSSDPPASNRTGQPKRRDPIHQVGGALWVLPLTGETAWSPRPVACFAHKPEGVTVLPGGNILIVFDDDGNRKSRLFAPKTFALDQDESVLTVVRADLF